MNSAWYFRVGHPVWDTPCGHAALIVGLESVIDNAQYSPRLQDMLTDMLDGYKTIRLRLKGIEQQLREFVDSSEIGQILLSIPGIGIINASAFLAAIDKGQAFNNSKEFAVWLGLTPKQHASGNISKMGGITKRGDSYLRLTDVQAIRIFLDYLMFSVDILMAGEPTNET